MTKSFDLTANELKAAVVLVQECLNGMGGSRPSDLDNDPYTWCDAKDLIAAGWTKEAAAGTYGSLAEKGFIRLDREGDCVSTAGYQFIDTLWDVIDENGRATGSEGQPIHPVTGCDIDPSEKEITMTVATIDISNLKVDFHADPAQARAIADAKDLLYVGEPDDLGALSGPQMVALYNSTSAELNTGLTPVNRFATKEAGIKRIMANLLDLFEVRRQIEKVKPKAVEVKQPKQKVSAPAVRRGSGINLPAMKKAYACREGSKQAILVDKLSRPQGATMRELLEALSGGVKPWKEVTVKSGLNWDMNKIKGYGIRTRKRENGEDCYHLVLPSGMERPVPHTPKKGEKN